jgi:hypothetical protein
MQGPLGVVQTIVQDMKDGKIAVEEIEQGLQDGDLRTLDLEAEAKKALTILQSQP